MIILGNKVERKTFVVLSAICIVWLFSLFLVRAIPYLTRQSNNKIFSSISMEDILSPSFGLDFLFFLAALIGIHLLFGTAAWLAATLVARKHRLDDAVYFLLSLALLLSSIIWILFYNATLYGRSIHAGMFRPLVESQPGIILTTTLGVALAAIYGYAIYLGVQHLIASIRKRGSVRGYIAVTSAVILIGSSLTLAKNSDKRTSYDHPALPNIIIIGIDSLRPDRIGFFNGGETNTPALNQFLESSAVFSETLSPLSRTFPAWISILSGRHPKNSGARYNLIHPSNLSPDNSYLPQRLRRLGYQTMIAMDERRFANIGPEFGFEIQIGPKMGAGDFVLASINDTPLSNVIGHTPLEKIIFPYSFINRGVPTLYDPERFTDEIASTLNSPDNRSPLLLVTHFCLPHWPYTWKEVTQNGKEPLQQRTSEEIRLSLYDASIEEVDKQFSRLLSHLQANSILDNAIIVLLSDHGESHGEVFDPIQYLDSGMPRTGVAPSTSLLSRKEWGHGTNILSGEQSNVLLAFRRYGGDSSFHAASITQPASLMDVSPTLYEALNINTPEHEFDGISLYPWIHNSTQTPPPRPRSFFVESGFSIPAIQSINPNISDLLQQGLRHYAVNPDNGRLEVRSHSHELILANKQRGVIRGDWILLAIKNANSEKINLILANRRTREWFENLSEVDTNKIPLKNMVEDLFSFYAGEIDQGRSRSPDGGSGSSRNDKLALHSQDEKHAM